MKVIKLKSGKVRITASEGDFEVLQAMEANADLALTGNAKSAHTRRLKKAASFLAIDEDRSGE